MITANNLKIVDEASLKDVSITLIIGVKSAQKISEVRDKEISSELDRIITEMRLE